MLGWRVLLQGIETAVVLFNSKNWSADQFFELNTVLLLISTVCCKVQKLYRRLGGTAAFSTRGFNRMGWTVEKIQ